MFNLKKKSSVGNARLVLFCQKMLGWTLIGFSLKNKKCSVELGFDLIFKKYSVLLYRFCHYFQKMIGWFLIGWEIFSKNARLAFNRFCAFFEKMIGFSIIGFTSFLKKCSVLDYRFCNRSFLKMIGLKTDNPKQSIFPKKR